MFEDGDNYYDDYEEYSDNELMINYIYMFGEPYDPIWDMYIDDFDDFEDYEF